MSNIRNLVEIASECDLFQSTAGRLQQQDQAMLLGPASLLADLISRSNTLNAKDSIHVCWLAPTGNEFVDDGKWLSFVDIFLNRDLDISYSFILARQLSPIHGPKPDAVSRLSKPKVQYFTKDNLPDLTNIDLLIIGHSQDSIEFEEWKVKALEGSPNAEIAALTYSCADHVVESIKWASIGLRQIASFNPDYRFASLSEQGSEWCHRVDLLSVGPEGVKRYPGPSTMAWLQKHSGEMGMLNPLMEPLSEIKGITPIKGGESIDGVYLVDDLVLLPRYQMLVAMNLDTTQMTPIATVVKEMINSMPSKNADYSEKYRYAMLLKLIHLKLSFESATEQFVDYLESKVPNNTATGAEYHQLSLHMDSIARRTDMLKLAVSKGSTDSLVDLAALLNAQDEGLEPDCIGMLRVASKQGSAVANFNLSVFAQDSKYAWLFEEDDAIKYLAAAGQAGLPEANYFLGTYYLGLNHEKWAIKHFEKAAMFGSLEAVEQILEISKRQMTARAITLKSYKKVVRKYRQFGLVT